jgi:hypothetical protein
MQFFTRRGWGRSGLIPKVVIEAEDALRASVLALAIHRDAGREFDDTAFFVDKDHNNRVTIREIHYWLKQTPAGRAFVESRDLQRVVEYLNALPVSI